MSIPIIHRINNSLKDLKVESFGFSHSIRCLYLPYIYIHNL